MPHHLKFMLFLSFLVLLFFSSCNNEGTLLDPAPFNREIRNRIDIADLAQFEQVFQASWLGGEKVPTTWETISEEKVGASESLWVLRMVADGLHDDSLRAEELLLKVHLSGRTWQVTQISIRTKCHEGRGHTSWGTNPCN